MGERPCSTLLCVKVFADEAFKKRLRERFVESIIEGYLGIVADAEHGLKDAEVARRIGINRGQFTRYKSESHQRPSLRNFCLRSAAANVSYPDGATVAFAAYCEAFAAVAEKMERPCPPITPETACCLYFLFRAFKNELAAGRLSLAESTLESVLSCVREYFPKTAMGGVSLPRTDLRRRDVRGRKSDRSRGPQVKSEGNSLSTAGKCVSGGVGDSQNLAHGCEAGTIPSLPDCRPHHGGSQVTSASDIRELLNGRVEIWANLVYVLGAPNDWF